MGVAARVCLNLMPIFTPRFGRAARNRRGSELKSGRPRSLVSLGIVAVCLLAAPASIIAVAGKSSMVPTPRPKPPDPTPPPYVMPIEARLADIPMPPPKPPELRMALASLSVVQTFAVPGDEAKPKAKPLPLPKSLGKWPKSKVEDARKTCERQLRNIEVAYKLQKPIGRPGGCGIAYPLEVSAIDGVKISPPATLNCRMVAALHRWLATDIQPAARRQLGASVIGIENASSYACRRRNNASAGKMSEHALGNALDIAEFKFEKKARIAVVGGWAGFQGSVPASRRSKFLRQARKGACAHFNTVLGPGSDVFHKTHFHVDLMKLRPGRGKYCR